MKTTLKTTAFAAFLALATALPASAATEGVDYEVVKTEVAPLQKDKIEVTEFFAYWCPHCKDLEPILLKHAKTFKKDTVLRTEHIVWDEGRDFGFARLAAAVKQAGLRDQADPVIFEAFASQRIDLGKDAILREWLPAQSAFDGKKVLAAYDSFSNKNMAEQMKTWTNQYEITGTPTVIVGGKYKVNFQQTGFDAGMKVIDELVQKVRDERGMKAPEAAKPVRSLGARFINKVAKAK